MTIIRNLIKNQKLTKYKFQKKIKFNAYYNILKI